MGNPTTQQPVTQKRVIVYMPDAQYNKLRLELLKRKKPESVSSWFRHEARKVTGDKW